MASHPDSDSSPDSDGSPHDDIIRTASGPLDHLVKGAPISTTSKSDVVADAVYRDSSIERRSDLYEAKKPNSQGIETDPVSLLPSSPPQIYLNLLILEASLRSQYLALHARRRQHIFFLILLGLWNLWFLYALFLRPREDGKGVGGSVYWVVDMGEKVAFMGGILTAVLIWGTGQWERGVRWPRRWQGVTNRGLRGMNLKVVVIRGPWWRQLLSYLSLVFPVSSLFNPQSSSYRMVEYPTKRVPLDSKVPRQSGIREEDIAPGGDRVKLLLLAKSFSPEFRENWENYRTEYWERENERRAELRKIVRRREREIAKQNSAWFWWLPGHSRHISRDARAADVEKSHHAQKPSKDGRRRRASTAQSGGVHSRSSSRSSTYSSIVDFDDGKGADGASKTTRRSKRSATGSSRRSQRMTPLDADEELAASNRLSMVSNASETSIEAGILGARPGRHKTALERDIDDLMRDG